VVWFELDLVLLASGFGFALRGGGDCVCFCAGRAHSSIFVNKKFV